MVPDLLRNGLLGVKSDAAFCGSQYSSPFAVVSAGFLQNLPNGHAPPNPAVRCLA